MDLSDESVQLNFPNEYLNSLKIPGLPVHKLILKIGAIVMLIRNISINDGLCNGTRLKILELHKFNIKVLIITGSKEGTTAFVPRIILDSGENSNLPFILFRRQFPIVLAFAITINKSQGQSFQKLGILFNKPLFSHGQLYVALSRCTDPNNLFIECSDDNDQEHQKDINNIVWTEIFE
ncbi:ATP-dependent DNA helicase pif1-like [Leptopilina heterotoma]|uniref:ATP-dependent DNA helicase pif1-like n=1 Tax=Leptopilina heterotoma TaxID=63436 RepID=UPI001CA8DD6A|nr:ATP-dependent DNA helicase pif1-like [Leptopilina heterotoma]